MARYYNPNRITMTERLAFNLSDDKKKVMALRKKKGSKGCLPWQRDLIVTTFGKGKKKEVVQSRKKAANEFVGDVRNKIVSEE